MLFEPSVKKKVPELFGNVEMQATFFASLLMSVQKLFLRGSSCEKNLMNSQKETFSKRKNKMRATLSACRI
jgi:hypothetical protein